MKGLRKPNGYAGKRLAKVSNLGFFGGSNMPRKLDGFWILQSVPQ
jgi:hypothetical protein